MQVACGNRSVPLLFVAKFSEEELHVDINGDGAVDVLDLLMVLTSWGPCPALPDSCEADCNGDAEVNVNDLLAVLTNWGPA